MILRNRNFNGGNLRMYVTQQGADVGLPEDGMEMSKHVGVHVQII